MKPYQKVFIFLLLGSMVFGSSCKKDDDPVSCNYALELQAEANSISVALNAYVASSTTANCLALVAAYQDYLDAAETYLDCADVAGQRAELQAEIDAARVEVNAFGC
jgi:hypothetical protein